MPALIIIDAGITSIALQASATSTASTITVPGSVIAGDILVLFDRPINSAASSDVTPPSGWSAGTASNSGNFRFILSYKLAVDADAGATVTGKNGTVSNHKMMYAFRPNIPALVLTLGDPDTNVGSPAQSVTTTAGSASAPVVVIGTWSQNTSVSPRTMSPPKDGEINASNSAYLGYLIFNSSPQDTTVSVDSDGPPNAVQALYLKPSLT